MFVLPVMKEHLSWKTALLSGRFIQVSLYCNNGCTGQSGTKPTLVAKILATKSGFVPDCWNENVRILMKYSSLAAREVVILTNSGPVSDGNFVKMMTFQFQLPCYEQTDAQAVNKHVQSIITDESDSQM